MTFSLVFIIVLVATVALGFAALKGRPRTAPVEPLGLVRTAVVGLMILAVVGLAITGYPAAFRQETVANYVLILHVMFAGPYLFALAAISLLFLRRVTDPDADASGFAPLTIISFWILAGTGAITGITMLVAMTPMFGTHGQHTLVAAHRIASVFAAFSAGLFAVCLFSDVRGRRNQINATTHSKETV